METCISNCLPQHSAPVNTALAGAEAGLAMLLKGMPGAPGGGPKRTQDSRGVLELYLPPHSPITVTATTPKTFVISSRPDLVGEGCEQLV